MASLKLINKFSKSPRLYNSIVNNGSIRVFSSKKASSGDSSSGDEKAAEKEDKSKNDKVVNRLNFLLQEMMKDEVNNKEKLILARPKSKKEKKPVESEEIKTEPVDQQIIKAVKNVAESIGGNKKQTESELLVKLLGNKTSDSENIAASVTNIVKGMKIDRETKAPESASRAQQVKQILAQSEKRQKPKREEGQSNFSGRRNQRTQRKLEPIEYEPIDLFGGEPLGIFKSGFDDAKQLNKTWHKLQERELKLAVTHPPANYFQEMILWTDQGKLWKFPIDNEYGLEEEKQVYFAEHVFLEKHLEPWCPEKGPIRHFMELVCVGLSKNAYMTVQDKREHIEWYKNYFEDKRKLLEEVGAFPVKEKTKEISSE